MRDKTLIHCGTDLLPLGANITLLSMAAGTKQYPGGPNTPGECAQIDCQPLKKASSPCANTADLATIALVNVTLVQLGMTMGKSMQEDLGRPGNWCKYYGMTTFHWAWPSLGGNIICGADAES